MDPKTGIHYGVISQNQVLQAWAESSEANYGKPEEFVCPKCNQTSVIFPEEDPKLEWGDNWICPECGEESVCNLPDCAEPISFYIDDGEYLAECGESSDIFILRSPFYTRCRLCSPCAPNAGYLLSPDPLGVETYCFGEDWFDDEIAPYPIFLVKSRRKKRDLTT